MVASFNKPVQADPSTVSLPNCVDGDGNVV